MSGTPIYDELSEEPDDGPAVIDFTDVPIVSLDDFPDAGPTEADMNGDQTGGLQL